jgi:hypothetical protein
MFWSVLADVALTAVLVGEAAVELLGGIGDMKVLLFLSACACRCGTGW